MISTIDKELADLAELDQEDWDKFRLLLSEAAIQTKRKREKEHMRIALLNTAVLTNFGEFSYQPISIANAKRMIESNGYESFIGHQATADILGSLLEVSVCVNRAEYSQQGRMKAIVFKLNKRIDVPRELTVDEIEEIGYTLGVLSRSDYTEDFTK